MENISVKELIFCYPKTEYPVLDGINLSVNQGEMMLLIGNSAAGKSTLLKLLKKEIAPAGNLSGSISVTGTVGYVSQNVYESIVSDRVRSELSFSLTNMGMDGESIELLVAETASYFNLEDKLDMDISTLSGGQVQMLNLASVMITKPDILLLDEPTSQLDPVSASRFIQMVERLHRDFGTTVVIVEHNLEGLINNCDSIALLDNGITKLGVNDMVSHLRNLDSPLLDLVPAYMRIFPGVDTVSRCRDILKEKALTPVIEKFDAPAIMKVRNIAYAYNRGVNVLDNLSMNVYKGKINCVLGPNSSGKSTLLFALAGAKKPYHGKIKSTGKVSMLCQNVLDLFTTDRCGDEVIFGEITDMLHIDYIEDRHPYDLSGGEAQRLALAKVLSTGADILLLDEPTKGFDPGLKRELGELLRYLCSKGKTVLLASHDIEFVGEYGDAVSLLSRGRIVSTLPRQDFFSSLNYYTTSVARITKGVADGIVCMDDLRKAGGI